MSGLREGWNPGGGCLSGTAPAVPSAGGGDKAGRDSDFGSVHRCTPTRSAVLFPSGPSPAHLAPAHPSLSGPGAKSVPTGSYFDRMPDAPTFSLLRGGIGAVIGAVVSSALLIGLSIAIGFRFPLFGIIIGYLTGLGARWMARGTDNSLGIVASVIALLAVTGSLVFLFNSFSPFNLITIAFAVGCAWRVSSG